MKAKEIKNLARQKALEGKTRTEMFQEIKLETKEKATTIAKTVRFVPTLEARTRYKFLNNLLGVILIITALLKMLAVYGLLMDSSSTALLIGLILGPAINVFFAIQVFKFHGSAYKIIMILTFLGVLRSLQALADFNPWMLIDYGLIVSVITLCLILQSKLVSDYKTKKVKVTDEQGKVKVRNQIYFEDPESSLGTLDENF